jgi:hypothetical protein
MSALLVPLVAIAGAVMFRLRGGMVPRLGSVVSAFLWAGSVALLAAALHFDTFLWLLTGTLMLGEMAGWGSYMRMGRRGVPPDVADNEHLAPILRWLRLTDGTLAYDLAGMFLRGVEFGLPSAILLFGLGYNGLPLLLYLAATFPIAYWGAWELPGPTVDRIKSWVPWLIDGPTAMAEVLIGFATSAAIAATVFKGPTGTRWFSELAASLFT